MSAPREIVFLLDVDNTLLDNDRVETDLREKLAQDFGAEARDRYWEILEEVRSEMGYVDYLAVLQRYRLENRHDPRVLRVSCWLVDYPFGQRLYPRAMDFIRSLEPWGTAVLLSDGDAVFQPRKVERSGLWTAVRGRVLIYVHKETQLAEVERFYPTRHYVMVDDKLRILTAVHRLWGERVTTVFARQGHYANDAKTLASYPAADVSVAGVSDLLTYDWLSLRHPPSLEVSA
jgi:FMN phosphatase YigB (HAD superfamily)